MITVNKVSHKAIDLFQKSTQYLVNWLQKQEKKSINKEAFERLFEESKKKIAALELTKKYVCF